MKIRNGFVSNSSSSSFVLVLPDNFVESVDYNKITNGEEDFPLDEFKKLLTTIIEDNGTWTEEIYDYERELDLDCDYEFSDIIYDLFKPYSITSIDTGPDAGQYVIVTREEIEEKLKNM